MASLLSIFKTVINLNRVHVENQDLVTIVFTETLFY